MKNFLWHPLVRLPILSAFWLVVIYVLLCLFKLLLIVTLVTIRGY